MNHPDKIIMISGGFDPMHIGHLRMIQHAARYGQLYVVVNSDDWLMRKKGYVFMPQKERCQILIAIRGVARVIPVKSGLIYMAGPHYNNCYVSSKHYLTDDDDTAIDAIRQYKPTYFANGGDRTQENVPEQEICDQLGVEMLWGIGGIDKPQSSSKLVREAHKRQQKMDKSN